ncbi:hypothetical protein O3P69_011464 [Scylla paramamosain]|uniref:Uncharacterized protein n=1 Tax=Scylla paramamosain TaxID=85552 RepID=A0AAW0T6T7_SCYPA
MDEETEEEEEEEEDGRQMKGREKRRKEGFKAELKKEKVEEQNEEEKDEEEEAEKEEEEEERKKEEEKENEEEQRNKKGNEKAEEQEENERGGGGGGGGRAGRGTGSLSYSRVLLTTGYTLVDASCLHASAVSLTVHKGTTTTTTTTTRALKVNYASFGVSAPPHRTPSTARIQADFHLITTLPNISVSDGVIPLNQQGPLDACRPYKATVPSSSRASLSRVGQGSARSARLRGACASLPDDDDDDDDDDEEEEEEEEEDDDAAVTDDASLMTHALPLTPGLMPLRRDSADTPRWFMCEGEDDDNTTLSMATTDASPCACQLLQETVRCALICPWSRGKAPPGTRRLHLTRQPNLQSLRAVNNSVSSSFSQASTLSPLPNLTLVRPQTLRRGPTRVNAASHQRSLVSSSSTQRPPSRETLACLYG